MILILMGDEEILEKSSEIEGSCQLPVLIHAEEDIEDAVDQGL
jgi:hypothetical protein